MRLLGERVSLLDTAIQAKKDAVTDPVSMK
jgi:hypothetical protein